MIQEISIQFTRFSGFYSPLIATYQTPGNWTPHVEITRPAWEATVDIFLRAGLITRRHRDEDAIAPPPADAERMLE